MKEKTNAYLLKQYESIAQLQRLLSDIINELEEELPPGYHELYIRCSRFYREDWLKLNGLTMSEEEKALWAELEDGA